ncbi:hypothetical protein [Chitinilyticum piscinae]|uniref:Uncharacterized protein n=1 Tax=Chitinilyticum piscinae TaxID=2866724 RepID=A0A8J7G0W3_9NEIS|nr:hypothetical protein [Chitinilyticum piscinae]MBE9609338.1 hypothetical protein [Chitinilyticum piscinae]
MQNRYHCGHAEHKQIAGSDWHASAIQFPCPACLRAMAIGQRKHTTAYVNLQQIGAAMASFVVEVSDATAALGELLSRQGYCSSSPARDELTHAAEAGRDGQVWRKEYHFGSDTPPHFVMALMQTIKQEVTILSEYCPALDGAVAFMAFPRRNADLEANLFAEHGSLEDAWHASAAMQ